MQPTECLRPFCNLQHTATDPAAFVTNAIQEDTGILLQHYYKLVLYGPGEKLLVYEYLMRMLSLCVLRLAV